MSSVIRSLLRAARLARLNLSPPERALAAGVLIEALREGSGLVTDRSLASGVRARERVIANGQWWWLDDTRHEPFSAEACCAALGWDRGMCARAILAEWERAALLVPRARRKPLYRESAPERRALDVLTLAVGEAAWVTVGAPPLLRRSLEPGRPCPGGEAGCLATIQGRQLTCPECRRARRRRANRRYWHERRRHVAAGGR